MTAWYKYDYDSGNSDTLGGEFSGDEEHNENPEDNNRTKTRRGRVDIKVTLKNVVELNEVLENPNNPEFKGDDNYYMLVLCDDSTQHYFMKTISICVEMGYTNLLDKLEQMPENNKIKLMNYMASLGNIRLMEYLADRGWNLNGARYGTPICEASNSGQEEVVKFLINRGVSVSSEKLTDPLHYACCKGNKNIVEILLKNGANVNTLGYGNCTALMEAATSGNEELVKLLIKEGAELNVKDDFGRTDFYIAIESGKLLIAKLLIDHGVLLEEGNNSILCAYTCRISLEALQWFIGLTNAMVEPRCIDFAVQSGKMDILQWLIQEGKFLDILPDNLDALLKSACEKGHLEVAKLLIKYGANASGKVKHKPILLSVCGAPEENVELFQLLLNNGAIGAIVEKYFDDWFLLNDDNFVRSPLLIALLNGYNKIARLILKNGGFVSKTALMVACRQNKEDAELVEMLIANGAEIDAVFHGGNPLLNAIKFGNEEIVKVLLKYGASVKAVYKCKSKKMPTTYRPYTYLHSLSSSVGRGALLVRIGRKLLERGAKLNVLNKRGETPLQIAVMHGHYNLVWLYATHGASFELPEIDDSKSSCNSVWDLECFISRKMGEALFHFWSPKSHSFHPDKTKDEIKSFLLVVKRLELPFDRSIMHNIISFIAYACALLKTKKRALS